MTKKEIMAACEEKLRPLLERDPVQQMKKYIQHGQTSTFDHSLQVAKLSLWISRRLHLRCDEQALVRGAMLHDFFLYDWHEKEPSHKWHGFYHPKKAMENAIQHFKIGKMEQQIIRCHMWPLTLFRIPSSREGWIVCMTDKYCSIREMIRHRKNKN